MSDHLLHSGVKAKGNPTIANGGKNIKGDPPEKTRVQGKFPEDRRYRASVGMRKRFNRRFCGDFSDGEFVVICRRAGTDIEL